MQALDEDAGVGEVEEASSLMRASRGKSISKRGCQHVTIVTRDFST